MSFFSSLVLHVQELSQEDSHEFHAWNAGFTIGQLIIITIFGDSAGLSNGHYQSLAN